MKSLESLIILEDPGWNLVQEWIAKASRPCEILEPSSVSRDAALLATQITTQSPMGAIIYESAGLLIDHGWLRVLGSGDHQRLKRSLPKWNEGRSDGFCLIADDAVGGFFALDGGSLGDGSHTVYYLAPDTLKWMPCNMNFSQFIVWTLSPSLDKFYESLRWPGWQDEVKELSGDRVISIYPFLWTKGPPLKERSRRSVPIEEFYDLNYSQNNRSSKTIRS
jgi:hypothetical protein